MFHYLFRFFFPIDKPADKLPLLPRDYSSHSNPGGEPDPHDIDYLQGKATARTAQDAQRLINKHKGQSVAQIARKLKRDRRKQGKLARAWHKLIELLRT